MAGTKFYHFPQNNSGGWFSTWDGLDVHVVIEATDADDANERAEALGIHFDVRSGDCGYRWHKVEESDAEDFPHLWGTPLEDKDEYERKRTKVHRIST